MGYAGTHNRGVPQYAGPFWIFGVAVLVGVLAWRLKFSGWGRALRALREDEIAAAAVGVDPTRYKVTSFVIAAIGGGIAGGLSPMREGKPIVSPDSSTSGVLRRHHDGHHRRLGERHRRRARRRLLHLQRQDDRAAPGARGVRDLKAALSWLDFNALRMVVYAGVLVA